MTIEEIDDIETQVRKLGYEIIDMDKSYSDSVRRQVNVALEAISNLDRYYWAVKDRSINHK